MLLPPRQAPRRSPPVLHISTHTHGRIAFPPSRRRAVEQHHGGADLLIGRQVAPTVIAADLLGFVLRVEIFHRIDDFHAVHVAPLGCVTHGVPHVTVAHDGTGIEHKAVVFVVVTHHPTSCSVAL
jgi:hypothetical protein